MGHTLVNYKTSISLKKETIEAVWINSLLLPKKFKSIWITKRVEFKYLYSLHSLYNEKRYIEITES